MRVEAQLRKDWLRKAGIRTRSDIKPAHATRLFMKSYRWVGLSTKRWAGLDARCRNHGGWAEGRSS